MQWQQPIRDRFGRGEAGILEVVAPAIGRGKPLPQPPVITEGRELRRVDRRDQPLLLARRDKCVGQEQPGNPGFTKQIQLGSDGTHSSSTVVTPPYVGTSVARKSAAPSAKFPGLAAVRRRSSVGGICFALPPSGLRGRLRGRRSQMDMIAEERRLPSDIDAQPLVRAAAALQPGLRGYHEEIEREQRLPPGLVEQLNAVGFYRMVIPRALGGLQVDPLTYLRVVELLAEGVGSVGWNIANNSVGQLVTLGLPDEGVDEIYTDGADTVIAGTAVPGGGQAVPVEGGYRVSGRWSFGSGCREAAWMLGSFQIVDSDCPTVADPRGRPRRSPDGKPLYWRGVFPRAEAEIVAGSWDVAGLRGTGSFDWTVEDVFLPERRTIAHAGIDALIDLAGGKTPRGRPPGLLCDKPQVQDAVGRADASLNAGRAYRTAMIAELWNTVAAGK